MGVERRPFTIKLDADNAAWIDELQSACLPLEVSKSSLVNSLVTIARTQIQVTPASVQITPRNLSNSFSTGAEPRKAGVAGIGGGATATANARATRIEYPALDASAEMPTAPIPLPKKLRRAERAS